MGKIQDQRFVPDPPLIAACIRQSTNYLFQAPYHIDLADKGEEGCTDGRTQGPWHTNSPVMKDVLSSNQDLGEMAVERRELGMRNKVNWRVWIDMLNIKFVSNGAFPTKVFPKTHFEVPNDKVEQCKGSQAQ